ncbi:MAG: RNA-binding protein [Candidatus Spechtbacteria bacterium SB0662_bin_43]|uniref:RNA-binding protein n=1 Tax=Candidatus Spechtbacteria bacterium SB0662_bin_43 TaxID=2604897 RepID=A0A845DAQ6_9BACT|nr:RNA-binding protein [Candidatus Spechtbacteria bacterium SB0662_bin_43]
MNKKLYIGGIPYATGEDSLRQLFEGAGTVEQVDIIIDNMTGRSRGFGFVEMATEEEAQKAIEMFHDKEFEGRMLSVKEARPREDRPRRDM